MLHLTESVMSINHIRGLTVNAFIEISTLQQLASFIEIRRPEASFKKHL